MVSAPLGSSHLLSQWQLGQECAMVVLLRGSTTVPRANTSLDQVLSFADHYLAKRRRIGLRVRLLHSAEKVNISSAFPESRRLFSCRCY